MLRFVVAAHVASVPTASPVHLGLVYISIDAPTVVLGLLVGSIADKVDLRQLLCTFLAIDIAAQVALSFALSANPFGIPLYLLVILIGLCKGLIDVSFAVYLVLVLPKAQLTTANARVTLGRTLAQALGPMAAGAAVAAYGAPKTLLATAAAAALALLAAAHLLSSKGSLEPRHRRTFSLGTEYLSIIAGLRFMFGHATLRPLAISACFSAAAAGIAIPLLIFVAIHDLHLAAHKVGMLIASGACGAASGSLAASRLCVQFGHGQTLNLGLTLDAVRYGAVVAGLLLANLPLAAAGVVTMGAGFSLHSISRTTLCQTIPPRRYAARVSATRRVILAACTPLGAALGTLMAEVSGVAVGLFFGVSCSGIAAVVATRQLRHIRH